MNISGGAGLEIYDATGIQITGNSNVGGTVTCNALAITGQPQNETVAGGGAATFSVVVAGSSGTTNVGPTFQWTFNGSPLVSGTQTDGSVVAGAATATLALSNLHAADAGSYACLVSNTLDGFNVTAGALAPNSLPVSATSGAATLTVFSTPTLPAFTGQSMSQTLVSGGTVVFNIVAAGFPAPTYQWELNGSPIAGATGSRLVTTAVAAAAGTYVCLATNSAGTTASSPATLAVSTAANPGRLVNLSVNALDGTGNQLLTVGFVSGGSGTSGTQTLLIRGTGPALEALGVNDVLLDPTLTVFGGQSIIASNTGWGASAGNQAAVTAADAAVFAFPLTNPLSPDSALVTTLAPNGYTVQVGSKSGGSGFVLAELYDDSGQYAAGMPRLVNLSCKQEVLAGGALTAGFTVGGTTGKTVLIRATGPALAALGVSGVVPDPTLTVFNGQTPLASNSGWGGDPQITAADNSVFAFTLSNPASKDSAVLLTLAPGAYTVQVRSASGTAGITLIEVYDVP